MAREPKGMEAARKEYEQAKAKDPEGAREHYANALAKVIAQYTEEFRNTGSREHGEEMQTLLTELKQHPAPKDADSKKLSAFMPGEWHTTRHEFLYKKNGTFVMLPEEKDAERGKWRIEGNQLVQTEGDAEVRYTIVLLNADYLVYGDKDGEFIMIKAKGKK
jgi:hypothetical protein